MLEGVNALRTKADQGSGQVCKSVWMLKTNYMKGKEVQAVKWNGREKRNGQFACSLTDTQDGNTKSTNTV